MTALARSGLAADALVVAHLAAMAAGLGAVLMAERALLPGLVRPVTQAQIALVHRAHATIVPALAVLWLSGAALLALRTGLDPALVTPKQAAKLATVTLLTLTAVAMSRLALPLLCTSRGQRLLDLPLRRQAPLAACGGLSAACWMAALVLGAARGLRDAGPGLALPLAGALAAGRLTGPVVALILFSLRRLRADAAPLASRETDR